MVRFMGIVWFCNLYLRVKRYLFGFKDISGWNEFYKFFVGVDNFLICYLIMSGSFVVEEKIM